MFNKRDYWSLQVIKTGNFKPVPVEHHETWTGNKVDIISCQFREFIAQFPGMYRMEWYIWKKSCMYRGKEMKRMSGLCSCECNLCSWVKKLENCRILVWYIPVIYSTTKCSHADSFGWDLFWNTSSHKICMFEWIFSYHKETFVLFICVHMMAWKSLSLFSCNT